MRERRLSDDGSDSDGQRSSLIEHVLLVHIQQQLLGEHVADSELLAQYPELMPELADRLQFFREIADQRATNMELETGDLERFISHYRIVGKLGAGGMGEVLLAEDTKLGRKVALKLLPAKVAKNSKWRQRFVTEAKAASALNHPNVCTIYEVGETDDQQPFIAMEYLAGQTLAEQGSLKIREIADIGAQLADALDAAHCQGIVHRDIKPSNISINQRGQVKVLDFGLAKRTETGLSTDAAAAAQHQTQDGQVLGTPNFMSPEQALGQAADHRTDIFSLGVVLYQLTTGRLPFAGSNASETRNLIVNAQPKPIARLNDDTPAELERIILKCLEKDAERRYQTARELLVDLRNLMPPLQPGQTGVAQAGTSEVVTLFLMDVADVNALKSSQGAQEAARQIESLHRSIREKLKAFPHAAQIEVGGDSVLLTFPKPSEALRFAIEMQGESARQQVKCRIGIDMGEVMRTESSEPKARFGQHLDTCASLMQMAGPGRILLGRAVFDSARQVLKLDSVTWANHGSYALQGIDEPIEVCELASGERTLEPPSNTEVGQRKVTADEEPVLGWRPAVGQRVPNTPWRLEKKLGEGGFGEVWLGIHLKLKEQRVFKFCFRADQVRSLKREVTLFRILKDRVGHHRGIVGIQDVYFDEPPFYLVMDYADGIALKSWCHEQGGAVNVPEEARLEIVAQVAEALQAAHDAGVIHRDVKPGNILVSNPNPKSEGESPKLEAQLTDFGIGQVLSQEVLANVTKTGFTQSIVADSSSSKSGTLLYMAPEVLSGNPASIRSDIYSLGVVLYQLVIGDFTRPITTDWSAAIADPLLREDLEHCFAGDPQQRFAGAAQLANHLRALPKRRTARAEQQAAMAAQARAAYRRGVVRTACVATAIVMAMAALAVWAIGSQRQTRRIAETRRQELYAAQVGLAHQAWVEGDLGRAQNLLAAQRPTPSQTDLRGFEWRYLWRLCQDESRRTLETLNDGAGPLGFSSDGIKLAMATGKIVKVRDFAGRREPESLDGHTDEISALVFSPTNPELLATGANDGTIKLWDLRTNVPVATLADAALGEAADVKALAFSPDGSRLAAVRSNGQVELWELATRRLAWSKQGHGGRDPALCVAFSSDGRLATGGGDTKVRLWNVATGEQDGPPLEGHTAWVFWLDFSPDGRLLATGGNDGLVLLWDVKTRQAVPPMLGHNGGVKSGAFSPDGRTLVSGGLDQTIRLWNVAASKQIRILRGHSASVHSLAFSPDGQSLVSSSEDHTVRLWDTAAQDDGHVLPHPAGWVETVALSPDGNTLASSDYHALTVKLWDVPSRQLIPDFLGYTGIPRCLTFSPDGKLLASGGDINQDEILLASGGDDQTVRVWDLSQHTAIAYQCGFGVRSVAFSSDGTILAAAGNGLKFWEVASGREIDLIQGDARSTRLIAFSSRGGLLATSDHDGNLSVWDANDGKETASFMVERIGASSSGNSGNLSFSSDDRFVALGKEAGTVILFDVTRAKKPQRLEGHTGQVFSVTFTPDSKTLASASEDGTVRLWNVASGQSALKLHHVGPITGVSFSGDGTLMATSGADGTVRLWFAASLSEADAPR